MPAPPGRCFPPVTRGPGQVGSSWCRQAGQWPPSTFQRHLLRAFSSSQLPSPYRFLQPCFPSPTSRRAASSSGRPPPLPPPSTPAPLVLSPPSRSPPHMLFPRQTNPRCRCKAAKRRPGGPSALLLIPKLGAVSGFPSSSSGAPSLFWLSNRQCRASTLPLPAGRRSTADDCLAKEGVSRLLADFCIYVIREELS